MCGNFWREADGNENRMPRSSEQKISVHLPDVGKCYNEFQEDMGDVVPGDRSLH